MNGLRQQRHVEEEEMRTKKVPCQWIESLMGTKSSRAFSKLITTDRQTVGPSAEEENYRALTSGKFFKASVA